MKDLQKLDVAKDKESGKVIRPQTFVVKTRLNEGNISVNRELVKSGISDYVKDKDLKDFCVITHLYKSVFKVRIYKNGEMVEMSSKNGIDALNLFTEKSVEMPCFLRSFSRALMSRFVSYSMFQIHQCNKNK